MDYNVRVKANHPTGVRHRGGMTFTTEPTRISLKQLTPAITKDPWLIIEEAKAGAGQEPSHPPTPAAPESPPSPEGTGGAGNDTAPGGAGEGKKKGWTFGKKKE
jgi:hypothetical protein